MENGFVESLGDRSGRQNTQIGYRVKPISMKNSLYFDGCHGKYAWGCGEISEEVGQFGDPGLEQGEGVFGFEEFEAGEGGGAA